MVNLDTRRFKWWEEVALFFVRNQVLVAFDEEKAQWCKIYFQSLFGKIMVRKTEIFEPKKVGHLLLIK